MIIVTTVENRLLKQLQF